MGSLISVGSLISLLVISVWFLSSLFVGIIIVLYPSKNLDNGGWIDRKKDSIFATTLTIVLLAPIYICFRGHDKFKETHRF